jgi:hypothetical protein
VLPAPLARLVGDAGDLHAEDERQARDSDRVLVRLGDHARVGDDRDLGQAVGSLNASMTVSADQVPRY